MQSLPDCRALAHHPAVNPQLSLFVDRLPRRPYATNDLPSGLRVMPAVSALEKRYVQYNGPSTINWLAFDIDRVYSLDAEWGIVAPPNIVVRNPANGHAHLLFGLAHGVTRTSAGRAGPLRLLSAISEAYRHALDADTGFAELICKNPLHRHWQVETPAIELYDMHDLSEWVDLDAAAKRIKATPKRELGGAGRNCSLFDSLRTWAYKAYAEYGNSKAMPAARPDDCPGFDGWAAAVLEKARRLNIFANPLPDSEVRATAKSVAKWLCNQYTGTRRAGSAPDDMTPQVFSMVQASLSKMAHAKRWGDNSTKQVEAVRMAAGGLTQKQIATQLEVTQQTVSNWLKSTG